MFDILNGMGPQQRRRGNRQQAQANNDDHNAYDGDIFRAFQHERVNRAHSNRRQQEKLPHEVLLMNL